SSLRTVKQLRCARDNRAYLVGFLMTGKGFRLVLLTTRLRHPPSQRYGATRGFGAASEWTRIDTNNAEHRRATHLREAKGSQGATWKFSPAAAGKVSSRVIQVTVNGQALGYKSCRNSSGDNPHCFAMVAHCISVDWVSTRDLDR